jgi:DNA modification methylase
MGLKIMSRFALQYGDCLEVLRAMPDNSIDAVVTDPPYGMSQITEADTLKALSAWLGGGAFDKKGGGFMGKSWDAFVPSPEVWRECYRVLKPGGHMAVFASSRTQDLMSISLRLAGFEIRDTLLWLYGSGFPKGLNIAKGIDIAKGKKISDNGSLSGGNYERLNHELQTEKAKAYAGYNTSLKPAYEPIILVRKTCDGSITQNVLKHGTGGLNIDACRVPTMVDVRKDVRKDRRCFNNIDAFPNPPSPLGRYPANILHDGSDEVQALFPETKKRKQSQAAKAKQNAIAEFNSCKMYAGWSIEDEAGNASRYFYCAKASKKDRDKGVGGVGGVGALRDGNRENTQPRLNIHPTVKPESLMRWLVKLVSPPEALILDPFMGSGSTGKACMLEGFEFIGIELNEEYCNIARQRIEHARKGFKNEHK